MTNNSNDFSGKTLGTCTLEKLVGQGGMGAVYLARQLRPSRHVAVKVLLPNVAMSSRVHQEYLARFRREADIIARLEHINIMPIYEYGEQDGLAYLVMPYLPGGSLRDVLAQRGALALPQTVTYMNQAAAALDYAHAHGIIHRDLKPANFLLHADGRLVLSDFGIARIMQAEGSTMGATLTGTGMLLGTPEYMAPEMLLGEQIDQRADIYELGIILFQMLSGQVPFKGDTPYAVILKQVQEPPPLLHQVNPAIPPPVDAVVQQAIAKKREDRFISAKALAQALSIAAASSDATSDTFMRNAPTVLGSPQSRPLPTTVSASNTLPPTPMAEPRAPNWSANRPSAGGYTPPLYPSTLPPRGRTLSGQPLWLMFIGVLLVIALVVGGVLIGLQLNRGGTGPSPGTVTTPGTPATATTNPAPSVTVGFTPPPQTAGIPGKGPLFYATTAPGAGCTGNGKWMTYDPNKKALVACGSTGTQVTNTSTQSPDLVGLLLLALPNNAPYPADYVIETTLQQAATSQASFGVYLRNQPGSACGVYTFLVHPDGSWSFYVYDNTCQPTQIKSGTFGDAHALVTIDVVGKGASFDFYADGHLVGTATDTTYLAGTAGIAVDAGGTITVSKFALYTAA